MIAFETLVCHFCSDILPAASSLSHSRLILYFTGQTYYNQGQALGYANVSIASVLQRTSLFFPTDWLIFTVLFG